MWCRLDFGDIVNITVQIIDPQSQSVHVNLNLDDDLSDIRQELEKHIKNIDLRTLAFAVKLNSDNKTSFSQVFCDHEEIIFLYEIIEDNILYLVKNTSKPNLNFLNEKHKLNYGRAISYDKIQIADNNAFVIENCKMNGMGVEDIFKRKKIEFNSEKFKMVEAELTFTDVKKRGVSVGKLEHMDTKFEACICTEIGRNTFKLELTPTQQFTDEVKEAINSKNPVGEFKKITERYGKFISTEVILGGRAYVEGFKSEEVNSWNIFEYPGRNTYQPRRRECFKLIGGQQSDNIKDFDEEAWVKSLKYFEYWECIEFRNPTSIFALLSEDLHEKIFLSVEKIILYSDIENFIYLLEEDGKPKVFELDIPSDISTIIQNKDADCNIFATVINTSKTNKDFFNCQIFSPANGKPSLNIHCIPEIFRNVDLI
jgi:hypothetical protein